jgi:hypothetical protein
VNSVLDGGHRLSDEDRQSLEYRLNRLLHKVGS